MEISSGRARDLSPIRAHPRNPWLNSPESSRLGKTGFSGVNEGSRVWGASSVLRFLRCLLFKSPCH